MSLRDIFLRHGTDKEINQYRHMYELVFRGIKDRPLNILEIGIGTMVQGAPSSMLYFAQDGYRPGGSLRSWKEYFPNSQIYGLDIEAMDTQFTEDRIITGVCDSTNAKQVEKALVKFGIDRFDIIIEDALHWEVAQLQTLKLFYPKVNPGGYYIMEDITRDSAILSDLYPAVLATIGQHTSHFYGPNRNIMFIAKSEDVSQIKSTTYSGLK